MKKDCADATLVAIMAGPLSRGALFRQGPFPVG